MFDSTTALGLRSGSWDLANDKALRRRAACLSRAHSDGVAVLHPSTAITAGVKHRTHLQARPASIDDSHQNGTKLEPPPLGRQPLT